MLGYYLGKHLGSLLLGAVFVLAGSIGFGQGANTLAPNLGSVSGAFQGDVQSYTSDPAIGTPDVPEGILFNGYGLVNYQVGKFSAGLRFEAFQNPLLGVSPRFEGQGIANRFIAFGDEKFNITAGNFYEQFGSGMVLRAYWEPLLGIDNAFNGFLIRARVLKNALQLKALMGRQRFYWDAGPGIVRGADAELDVVALLDSAGTSPLRLQIGASAVSRYLEDDNPTLKLPNNVGAFSGRLNMGYKNISLFGEYVFKSNDPAQYNVLFNNLLHYNPGGALLLNISYSRPNYGFSVEAKRLENMDFRSARDADFIFNELPISFLPPLTKQHTWRLQTLYLYATQPNGEVGAQADAFINFPKESLLGGKYGMNIHVNYSRIHGIARDTAGLVANLEYASADFLNLKHDLFYEDFNIEINRKISSRFKATLAYIYMRNRLELQGLGLGISNTHLVVFEGLWKFKPKQSVRFELQHLYSDPEKGISGQEGSWAMAMAEYSVAPHWFFVVSSEYNYGNFQESRRLVYYAGQMGYVWGSNRITFGYARQRQGILCVGGVCRILPASNGFQASFSTTF